MCQTNLCQAAAERNTTRTRNLPSPHHLVAANPSVNRLSRHSALAVASRRLNETWTNVATKIAIDLVVAVTGERVIATTTEFDAKTASDTTIPSDMTILLVAPKPSPRTPNGHACRPAISVPTFRSTTSAWPPATVTVPDPQSRPVTMLVAAANARHRPALHPPSVPRPKTSAVLRR